jgi:hypothetical protein
VTHSVPRAARPVLDLLALGRDKALVTVLGRRLELRPKLSEILVVLMMHPQGLTAEGVALHVYGDAGNTTTVRAEIHRLRAALGSEIVRSQPYALIAHVEADFLAVRAAVRQGQLRAALNRYAGPLLPASDAPAVKAERINLEQRLRAAVLSTRVPSLIDRWVESCWGADDAEAWETLAEALPATSPQRAAAAAQARLLGGLDLRLDNDCRSLGRDRQRATQLQRLAAYPS